MSSSKLARHTSLFSISYMRGFDMKYTAVFCALIGFVVASSASAQSSWPVLKQERKELDKSFELLWKESLVWKLDELPIKGYVAKHRVPYAGAIYPDNMGGTWEACQKYDRAFYRGYRKAAAYESWDSQAHRTFVGGGGGFFFGGGGRYRVPDWSGHCNGWAASAIRHAEPKYSIKHNGVLFTPKDIKSLLAEVYTFSGTTMLGGAYEHVINPASFHVTMTNWIGRHDHPIAMETTPGKEVWNYPVYAYNTTVKKHKRGAEVKVMIAYKHYLEREQHKAPANTKNMYFHYFLDLDKDGRITGGEYYGDSNVIDFLWAPLAPTQGGKKRNEMGNPHINLEEVLTLWRKSVHDDKLIAKWINVDPRVPKTAKPADEIAKTDASKESADAVAKAAE